MLAPILYFQGSMRNSDIVSILTFNLTLAIFYS